MVWRGRREPLYAEHSASASASIARRRRGGALWIHAVSLGETRAAGALIAALRAEMPGLRIVLTNGRRPAAPPRAALLRDGDEQAWLPFDTPGAVRRFLRHFGLAPAC